MPKNKAAQELGRKGGNATLAKHGKEYYKKIRSKKRKKVGRVGKK